MLQQTPRTVSTSPPYPFVNVFMKFLSAAPVLQHRSSSGQCCSTHHKRCSTSHWVYWERIPVLKLGNLFKKFRSLKILKKIFGGPNCLGALEEKNRAVLKRRVATPGLESILPRLRLASCLLMRAPYPVCPAMECPCTSKLLVVRNPGLHFQYISC